MHNTISQVNVQHVFDDYLKRKSDGACLCQLGTYQWFSFDTLMGLGWNMTVTKLQDSQLITPINVGTVTPR